MIIFYYYPLIHNFNISRTIRKSPCVTKTEEDISLKTKECPMCAETIKAKAIICRFCGHKFESETNSVNEGPP